MLFFDIQKFLSPKRLQLDYRFGRNIDTTNVLAEKKWQLSKNAISEINAQKPVFSESAWISRISRAYILETDGARYMKFRLYNKLVSVNLLKNRQLSKNDRSDRNCQKLSFFLIFFAEFSSLHRSQFSIYQISSMLFC